MRTKIIAGNLFAVLVVGLVSYFVVSTQIQATFLEEVDSQIANDAQVFERTWRLSGLEFVSEATEQATASDTQDVFTALDESSQRDRAFRRANAIADWFGRRNRGVGPPELVIITDDRGIGIARNQDRNRMHGEDLKRQLGTLDDALDSGEATVDVWSFSSGQDKLLQTAIAPIRDPEGAIRGALIVGYDMSNGMASRSGELLSRDVVFFTDGTVYSSSLRGELADQLRAMLFDAQSAVTAAALGDGGGSSDPFLSQVGEDEFVGVVGALPFSPSTQVGYAMLGNRTEQAGKASAVNAILLMTGLGFLIVLIYGFLIGTSLLKPIEEMEEGVLAVINGRTDLRLDIESAELGGLAYRINQLLNVFTGTPEEDEEGRVSSPPEAWSDAGPPTGGGAAAPSAGADEDDPELAAKLAAEPEDAYYTRVYTEYVAAKEAAGENVSNITQDRFVQRLQANEKSLIKKHGCRMVRFQVQVKGTQVNLRPVIIQ
ncbi:MAG: MXAN_5187 C-terminal domain-containing protein [Sandaracinaceae bacterium]